MVYAHTANRKQVVRGGLERRGKTIEGREREITFCAVFDQGTTAKQRTSHKIFGYPICKLCRIACEKENKGKRCGLCHRRQNLPQEMLAFNIKHNFCEKYFKHIAPLSSMRAHVLTIVGLDHLALASTLQKTTGTPRIQQVLRWRRTESVNCTNN